MHEWIKDNKDEKIPLLDKSQRQVELISSIDSQFEKKYKNTN